MLYEVITDWVESCTAVAETAEGVWELIHFHHQREEPLLKAS